VSRFHRRVDPDEQIPQIAPQRLADVDSGRVLQRIKGTSTTNLLAPLAEEAGRKRIPAEKGRHRGTHPLLFHDEQLS
jgi:hypothetical protein